MQIDFSSAAPASGAAIALLVEKEGLARLATTLIDAAALDLVKAAAQASRFDGEAAAVVETFVADGTGGVRRVLLLGTGAAGEAEYERAGGALTARLLTSGVQTVSVDFGSAGATPKAAARFAAAAAQRGWRHDIYRTKLPEKSKPTLTTIVLHGAPEGTDAAWSKQKALTEGLELTRTLVAEPPNVIYPETFVAKVRAEVEGLGLEITVLGEAEMRELGMGSLLGVSQGSAKQAQLLALKWNGAGAGDPALALVGKGVTFDTGGISLKPAGGMEDMKWDMGGAGAVAGAMKALAGRKAKAYVVGVCGLVENMPDGNAQRPGDIVTSMSGQTIEVLNTDAEGRLVLGYALHWVQENYNPEYVVDLATLTGAIIVSLGSEYAGLFSNSDDLADKLTAAGKASGDPLWRFPLSKAYDKMIDSPIADMKNIGGKGAGSITAAQFLGRFIKDGVKWAHLDIAGTVWADKAGPVWDKGATGFGVRLLDRFVADNFEG